jgi:hypothetical protein
MSIEIGCTGCGQTLRVADEHGGKKARCPACGTIVLIPSVSGGALLEPAPGDPFAAAPLPRPDVNPFADRPAVDANPYAPPAALPDNVFPRLRPNRGGAILTLGIISLMSVLPFGMCCLPLALASLPCGIIAWTMAASDLKEIRSGRMDPSGQGMVRAGMVLGILGIVLCVLMIAGMIAMFVVSAANAC